MEITSSTLRDEYERLSSERLLELQSSRTLTDLAQTVVEQILDERDVPFEDDEDELDSNTHKEQAQVSPPETRLEVFCWTLVRWWGVLFRALFISTVGIVGYFWFDPKSIGDIPFSQLTLNHFFENIFGIGIAVGCIWWFFNFPDQSKSQSSKDNPYVVWGQSGGCIVLLGVMAYFVLVNNK